MHKKAAQGKPLGLLGFVRVTAWWYFYWFHSLYIQMYYGHQVSYLLSYDHATIHYTIQKNVYIYISVLQCIYEWYSILDRKFYCPQATQTQAQMFIMSDIDGKLVIFKIQSWTPLNKHIPL